MLLTISRTPTAIPQSHPGNISPDSSDDLTKDLLSSLSILTFPTDVSVYVSVLQAYDVFPQLPMVISCLPAIVTSPLFDSEIASPEYLHIQSVDLSSVALGSTYTTTRLSLDKLSKWSRYETTRK
ncbi:hypothetical protein Tco_0425755 [Tanacetum coccineum]